MEPDFEVLVVAERWSGLLLESMISTFTSGVFLCFSFGSYMELYWPCPHDFFLRTVMKDVPTGRLNLLSHATSSPWIWQRRVFSQFGKEKMSDDGG